jgi:ABC-type nitrate/sulfonate/bicarbonate transport system permease component
MAMSAPAASESQGAVVFGKKRARALLPGARPLAELGATIGFGALGMAVVLLIWWAAAVRLGPLRLPDPWTVFVAIKANWRSIPAMQYVAMQGGGVGDALAFTVVSVLVTVAFGAALGVLVGVALPHVAILRLVTTPALAVLGSTPLLILLPFLVQWFGPGRFVRSGIVVIFTFVVMATVCFRSSAQAIGSYGLYARSLGAKPAFEMWHVVIPALVPDLIAGLRVSLSTAWGLEAVAEIVGGKSGIGRIISTMAHLANTTVILAVVVCLCVTAVGVDGVLTFLVRRSVAWRD